MIWGISSMSKVGDMSWILYKAERFIAVLKKTVRPKSLISRALFTVVEVVVFVIAGLLSLGYVAIFFLVLRPK
jgi:hypothetical protein